MEFNENLFNFNNLAPEEKFFKLDLLAGDDSEKNEKESQEQNKSNSNNEIINNSELGSNDLITVNQFPIALSHCNLVINHDKNYCQVLSNELIGQALEIFNHTKKPTLKLGFNSLGAGCIINHLHFELFWTPDDSPKLAIENCKSTKLFSTNLEHLVQDEINISVVSNFNKFTV